MTVQRTEFPPGPIDLVRPARPRQPLLEIAERTILHGDREGHEQLCFHRGVFCALAVVITTIRANESTARRIGVLREGELIHRQRRLSTSSGPVNQRAVSGPRAFKSIGRWGARAPHRPMIRSTNDPVTSP